MEGTAIKIARYSRHKRHRGRIIVTMSHAGIVAFRHQLMS